jgi:arabinogalactan oligomer/maltooligosaccharide transport system permease protein
MRNNANTPQKNESSGRKLPLLHQLGLQLFLGFIAFTVLYPMLWIFSLSINPTDDIRPKSLVLIPEGATFQAYKDVLDRPTPNPVSFAQLFLNSLKLSLTTAAICVLIGVFFLWQASIYDFGINSSYVASYRYSARTLRIAQQGHHWIRRGTF